MFITHNVDTNHSVILMLICSVLIMFSINIDIEYYTTLINMFSCVSIIMCPNVAITPHNMYT